MFTVLVDPRTQKAIFWDESRWLASGRITRRCSEPPQVERRSRSNDPARRVSG
jgi:hypothetical protein